MINTQGGCGKDDGPFLNFGAFFVSGIDEDRTFGFGMQIVVNASQLVTNFPRKRHDQGHVVSLKIFL